MMENLATSTVVTASPVAAGQIVAAGQVQPVVTISGVNNINGITTVPSVAQIVGTSVPTISQVWYNCGTDGISQLVAANPSSVMEINGELARQFNQQVQTPYGNIQVQVQPSNVSSPQLLSKPICVSVSPQEETVTTTTTVISEGSKQSVKSRVRQTGNERVPCPTCGKTVSCNATLRDHMRTHTGDRPFVCSECGFAFAQRSNLRMHKRLHTGERPYMCGICGKTFARSSHLPAHMRTHTGEKPYVCEACNHAFITAQQLKNHFRVHTGEKPWKCDLCPAAFTHSSSLSTHKKKHTGMKPYQCEKCQKSFFFTSALDKHMKVHSKARPFKCDECDKSFKYKESLTVHKEKYCGKETTKKTRAPRRADARKPGPKPGSGRKYVQKRRGRPRGRPKKRGRWSQRVKARRNYQEMEDMVEITGMDVDDEEMLMGRSKEELDDDEEDEEEEDGIGKSEMCEEVEVEIPAAELKVEVINPDENDVLTLSQAQQEEYSHALEHSHQITGELIQMQPANEIHIDETTALTIVSAEEAEQQVANGGMQLVTLTSGMPIQFVQHEGEDGQITHQLITRDGIQMWYPRQFQ